MTTTEEIELAIKALPQEKQWALVEKLQDEMEDKMELTAEFKDKIEQGKKDIAEGRVRIVNP